MTQNMTCWSSEDDELLIDFVKNHEMLYNVKSKYYRQAQLKQNLWCEIGDTLNKTDVDCSKRWAYVRDYYIRRRGKLDTGSSGEAAKKSTVTNVVGDENSKGIITETVATEEDTQVNSEESDITQHEELLEEGEMENICNERRQNLDNAQPPKKRKRSSQSEERLQLLKQIAQRHVTSPENQFDETDHFFMSMAKTVKKLPRYEQAQLRMEISTLVGNAELQHFSTQSECSDPTSRATSSCHHIFVQKRSPVHVKLCALCGSIKLLVEVAHQQDVLSNHSQ
ncbi:hypothetical protein B7P43_G01770 [Cryptotermes secundus]|uniref:MADF domain-containing protein n=1 Tax=Cryptotermes secundus TaxID=105785 RepID=A0A2J7QCR3_9NEOP|nr:hypothetical protein B7P43_G01770 [Cryptotermes secundus]